MKKIMFTLVLFAGITFAASAQSTIMATAIQTTAGVLKIDKIDRPALVSDFNIDASTLEDALKDAFKTKGTKLERSKGLLLAKGVTIPEMGNSMFDLYFDIDRMSRSEKDKSTMKLAISSGYDNFVSADKLEQYEGAKKYVVNSLSPALHTYKLQSDITAQTETFNKAQKKYNDLIKENEKLEKQRKNLESDIAVNKKDQESQLREIEKQKNLVEQLKSTQVK